MELPLQKRFFSPSCHDFRNYFLCVFLTFLHESIAKWKSFLAPGLDPKVLCFQVLIVTVSCSNVPCLLTGINHWLMWSMSALQMIYQGS